MTARSPGITIERREALERTPAHELALECLVAGIDAAHPERVVRDALSLSRSDSRSPHSSAGGPTLSIRDIYGETASYDLADYERAFVVGGGNAAGHLASALESLLGDVVDGGAVVTDDPTQTDAIDVLPGDHPFPSERGRESTRRLLEVAREAGEDDLVLACLTGGGSALAVAPAGSLAVDDLRSVTDALLRSGASIDEINAVRKHCSAIKGGGLAEIARPATVVGLVLSDVVGDDLGVIASGPISPDPTTYDDALAVLERYGIDEPAVVDHLGRGANGDLAETPSERDETFDAVHTHLIASSTTALEAARDVARERGYAPMVLSSRIRGEAREVAKVHIAMAEESLATGHPISPPAVLLSGGEATVTVRGDGGTGGPSQEFALSGALELAGDENGGRIVLASVDTDGIDGPSDVAGAIVDSRSLEGVSVDDARTALEANDVQPVLEEVDALIRTGPTGTNVNDLRVAVVTPE